MAESTNDSKALDWGDVIASIVKSLQSGFESNGLLELTFDTAVDMAAANQEILAEEGLDEEKVREMLDMQTAIFSVMALTIQGHLNDAQETLVETREVLTRYADQRVEAAEAEENEGS